MKNKWRKQKIKSGLTDQQHINDWVNISTYVKLDQNAQLTEDQTDQKSNNKND